MNAGSKYSITPQDPDAFLTDMPEGWRTVERRLLDAAPDVLAALKECLNQLETNDLQGVYNVPLSNERRNMLSAAKLMARKAIAKSEGKSA